MYPKEGICSFKVEEVDSAKMEEVLSRWNLPTLNESVL